MKKVFVLVMALAVMVSASVYAQGNNSGNERRQRPNNEQCNCPPPKGNKGGQGRIDMSKLSEVQKAEVRAIQKKYEIDLSNFSLDIKKQDNVIKAEMMKDSPDKSTIDSAIDTKSTLEASKAKMMVEMRLAIDAVVKSATKPAASTQS